VLTSGIDFHFYANATPHGRRPTGEDVSPSNLPNTTTTTGGFTSGFTSRNLQQLTHYHSSGA